MQQTKHTSDLCSTAPPAALPRHIVWDWNGTLCDDVQAAVNSMNAMLGKRRLPLIDVAEHRGMFRFPVRDYYDALGFQLDIEDWDALAKEFADVFHADFSARLFDGARDVLRRLADAGVAMSVLSACEQGALDAALDRHGLRGRFVAARGLRHNGADSKLEAARALFAEIGAPFDDVWMIGDTAHDSEVAAEAGCQCLLVCAGYQSRKRLLRVGVPVLDSVADVPGFFGV